MRVDVCNLHGSLYDEVAGGQPETIIYSSSLLDASQRYFNAFQVKAEKDRFKKRLYEVWVRQMEVEQVSVAEIDLISRRIDRVVSSACFNLGKEITPEITIGEIRIIGREIIESVVAIGNKPTYSFSYGRGSAPKRLLFSLLMDEINEIGDIDPAYRERLLRAVFWERDPELLAEAREGLRETLLELYEIVLGHSIGSFGSLPHLPLEAAIGNLLAIYPFLDPQEGEILSVPLKVDSAWHLKEYSVGKIPLTPNFFPSPMYAFVLTPLDEQMPPILLFKGTTYPTDDGFFISILSDLNPFASVGEYAFRMGKVKLKQWLDASTTSNRKARVYGMSLGGSLSLQTAIAFPSQIEQVHAYSPPALSHRNIRDWQETTSDKPEVFVYCNEGDFVPQFGMGWAEDWNVMDVIALEEYNPILSHCRIFTAEDVILMERNVGRDHESFTRRFFSTLQMIASLPIFCLLALVFLVYTAVKRVFRSFFTNL